MRPIWWFYVTKHVIYRCTVTRGFRLMNIQSTRGKVLTATAALISLPKRCQSGNNLWFFFGGGAKWSKDGDDSEACEWWRNLWTVLQYWQAESVKYDTCFQKSSFFALATKVWTFRSQWLPNIFLCVQGWAQYTQSLQIYQLSPLYSKFRKSRKDERNCWYRSIHNKKSEWTWGLEKLEPLFEINLIIKNFQSAKIPFINHVNSWLMHSIPYTGYGDW